MKYVDLSKILSRHLWESIFQKQLQLVDLSARCYIRNWQTQTQIQIYRHKYKYSANTNTSYLVMARSFFRNNEILAIRLWRNDNGRSLCERDPPLKADKHRHKYKYGADTNTKSSFRNNEILAKKNWRDDDGSLWGRSSTRSWWNTDTSTNTLQTPIQISSIYNYKIYVFEGELDFGNLSLARWRRDGSLWGRSSIKSCWHAFTRI